MRHVRLFPRALRKTQPEGSTSEYKELIMDLYQRNASFLLPCLKLCSALEALSLTFSFGV
jgi:hypothetical protein